MWFLNSNPSELYIYVDLCYIDLLWYPDIIFHLFAKFQNELRSTWTFFIALLCELLSSYFICSCCNWQKIAVKCSIQKFLYHNWMPHVATPLWKGNMPINMWCTVHRVNFRVVPYLQKNWTNFNLVNVTLTSSDMGFWTRQKTDLGKGSDCIYCSHKDWKTWKNGKTFSSQGILNRLKKIR